MFVLNITDDYDSFTNCTNNENDDIYINMKFLLLSIAGSIILLSCIGLIIWTMIKSSIIG